MRSLSVKLTLAFLLVGLTGSILVALIVRQRTQLAFDQFLYSREDQSLAETLSIYYEATGSWAGVAENLSTATLPWSHPGDDKGNRRELEGFTLATLDGRVVQSYLPGRQGTKLTSTELEAALPLEVNGETVGWLLSEVARQKTPREWVAGSPESLFLANVTSASLVSALVAGVLALSLGGLLAFTLTRSLRELTDATVEIARGQLGGQVKVRTRDELGDLAASFNKMSLDLEHATQLRRQMTADIAHDLRSPLSVLTGYAEALSDGKLPGTPEVYGILHQETKHLSRLVDDLRTLSLADAGELPLVLQPIAPQVLLERVAARQSVTAQQKGLVLRVAESSATLPEISVDVERMAQVFDNLVLNAFRYTPPGGEIVLAAREIRTGGAAEAILEVRDTGSGIAPEDLPHIFERFYRGDPARQQSGESGLGLAIARSIVEAHGGTLTAANAPGGGAVFTIRLGNQAPSSQAPSN